VFTSTQDCGATNDLVTYDTLHSNPTGISNDMMLYLQNGTSKNYHVAFCDSTTKLYYRAANDPSGDATFSIAEFTGTAHADLANASYYVVACGGIGGSALSTRAVTGTQYNAGTRVYFENVATPEVIISTSSQSCAATNLKAAKLDVTIPASLSASFSPGMKLHGEVPGTLAGKTVKVFTSDLGCTGTALVAQHTLHSAPLGITNDTVLYVEQGGTTYYIAFCDGTTNLLKRTRSEGSAGHAALNVAKVTGSLHADLAAAAYKVVACSDVGGSLLSSETVSTSTFNGGGTLYFESSSGTPDVVITSGTDCTASNLVAASLDTTPSSSDYAITFSPTAKIHGEVPASIAEKTVRVFTSDVGCSSDATKARQTLPASVSGSDDLKVYVPQGPTYYITLCDGSTKRLVRTKAVSSADVTFSVGGVHTSTTGKVHTDLEDSSHYIVACDAISGNLLSSESVTGTSYEGGTAYQYYEVSSDDSSVVLAVSSSASSCVTTGLSAARTESDMDRGEEVTFDPEAKGSGDIPNDDPTVRVFLTDPGSGACDTSGQLYASADTSTDSSQSDADYAVYGQNGVTYYLVFCNGTSRALETSTANIGTADIDVGRLQGEVHADLRSGDDVVSIHSANDCSSMVSSETVNPTAATPDYRIWFEDTTGGTYYIRTVVDSTYTQCGHAFTLTSQAKVQNMEGKISGIVPSSVLRMGLDYDSNGDDAWTTSFSSSAYRLFGDSADTSVLAHAYEDTGGSTEVLERTRNINTGDKTLDVAKVTAGEALHDDLDDADDHLVVCTLPGGSVLASEDITGTSYEGGNTLYFDATSQTTVYFGSSSASLDCTGSTLLTSTKQTSVSAGGHYRYIPKYKLTGDVPTGVDRALLFSAAGKGCTDVDGDLAGYDGNLAAGQSDNDYDLYVNKTDGSTFRLVFCNGASSLLQSAAQSSISAAVDIDVARVASGGASKVHDDLNSLFIVACTAPDGTVLTSESVTGTSFEGGSTYQYFEVTQSTAYFAVSGSASSCSAAGLSAAIKLSVAGGSDYTFSPEAKGAGDIPNGDPSVRMFVDDPGTDACGGSQIYVSSDSSTDASQSNADYAVYGQNGVTYYVVFCNGTTKALETTTTGIGTADIDVGRLHGEVHADLRTGSNDIIEVHDAGACSSAVSSETVNPVAGTPDYYIWFEDTGSTFYVRTSVDSGQYVQCGHAFTLTSQASTQDLETRVAGTMPSGVLRVGLDYDSNGDDTYSTTFQSSAFKLFGDNADSAVLVHAYEDTGGSTEVLERTRDLTAGDRTFDVARVTTPQAIHDDLDDTGDYIVACSAPGGSALVSESINGATFEGGTGNGDVLYVDVTGISDMYLAVTSSSLSCTGTNIITATKQSSLSGGSGYAYTPLYKVTGDVPSGPTYAKLFAAASKGCTDVDADLRGYDGSMTTAQSANDYDLYVNKTDSSTFYAVFCDGSNNRLFEASGRTVSGATTISLGKGSGEAHSDLENAGTADNIEVFSNSACTTEVSRHDTQPVENGSGVDYTVYFESTGVTTFYLKATKDAGANAQCGLSFTLTSQAATVQLDTKASGAVPSTVTSVGIDYGKTGSDDLVSKGSLGGSYALYGDVAQTSIDVHVYDSGGEVLERSKSLASDFVLDVAKVKSSGPIHGDLADGNHYALACKSPGSTKLNSKVVSGLNFNDGSTDLYFEKDGSQVFFTISTASDGCQVTAINGTTPQSSVTGGTTYYYTPSRRFSGKIPLGPTHVRLFSASGQTCTTGGLNFRGYDGGVSHGTASDYTIYTNATTSETFYVLFCDWSNNILLESTAKSVPDDLALSLARVGGTVHTDLTSKNIVVCSAIGDTGTRISSASVTGSQFNGGTYQYYEPSGSSVYFGVSSSSSSCASSDLSAAVSTTVAAGDTDTFTATDKATGDITANNPTVRLFISNPDTNACQSSGQDYVSSDTSTDSSQSNADYDVYGHDGQSYYMVFCEGTTALYESALITDLATADIDIARVHTSGANKVHADIKGSTYVVVCSAVGDSGASISTAELAASSYDNGGTSYMYFEVPGSGDVYFALSTSGTSCASSNLRAGIKTSTSPGATVTFDPVGKLKGDIPSDNPSVRVFTEDPGSSACLATGQDYIAADTSTDYTQNDADYAVYGQDGDTYYVVYCDGTSKGVQATVSSLAQAGTDLDVGKVSGDTHTSLETAGDGNDRVDVYSDSSCTTKVSSETVQPADANNPDYSILFTDTTAGTYYIKTTVVASGKTYEACGTPFTLTSQTKTNHHLTARLSGTVPVDVPRIGLDYDDNGDDTYTTTFEDQVYMLFGDATDTQVRVHAYEDTGGSTEVLERVKSLAGGTVGFDVAKVRALEAAIHDDLDDSGDHVVVCTAPGGSALVSEDITGTSFEGVSGNILYFDATSLSEAFLAISSGALDCTATNLATVTRIASPSGGSGYQYTPLYKVTGDIPAGISYVKLFSSASQACTAASTTLRGYDGALLTGQSANDYDLYVNKTEGTTLYAVFCDSSNARLFEASGRTVSGNLALHIGKISGEAHSDLENAGTADNVEVFTGATCTSEVSRHDTQPAENGSGVDYTAWFESTGASTFYVKITKDAGANVQCGHSLSLTSQAATVPLHGKAAGSVHADILKMGLDHNRDGTDEVRTSSTLSGSYAIYGDGGDSEVDIHAYLTGDAESLERLKDLTSAVTLDISKVTAEAHKHLDDDGSVQVYATSTCTEARSTATDVSDSGGADVTVYFDATGASTFYLKAATSTNSTCGNAITPDGNRVATADLTGAITGTVHTDITTVSADLDEAGGAEASTSVVSGGYALYTDGSDTSLTVSFDTTGGAVLSRSGKNLAGAAGKNLDVDAGRLTGDVHADLRTGGNDVVEVYDDGACASKVSSATVNPTAATPDYTIYFEDTGSNFYIKTSVDSTYVQCGHQFTLTSQAKVVDLTARVAGTVPSAIKRIGLDQSRDGNDEAWTTTFSSGGYKLFGDAADTAVDVHAFEDTSGSTEVLERTRDLSGVSVSFDIVSIAAGGALHDDLDDTSDHVVACSLPGGSALTSEDITGTAYEGGDTLYVDTSGVTDIYLTVTDSSHSCTSSDLVTVTKQSSVTAGGTYGYRPLYKVTGDIPSSINGARLFTASGKGCSDVDGTFAGYDGAINSGLSANDYDLYVNATDSDTFYVVYCTGSTRVLQSTSQSSISSNVAVSVARISSGGADKVSNDLNAANVLVCTAPGGTRLSSETVTGSSFDGGSTYQHFETSGETAYAVLSSSTTSCASADLQSGVKLTSIAGGGSYTFSPSVFQSGDIPNDNPTVRLFIDDPGTGACGGGQAYVSSDTSTDSGQSSDDYKVYGQDGATYYVVFCNGTDRVLEASTSNIGAADIDVGRLQGEVHADLRTGGNDVIEVHDASSCASAVSTETVNPAAGTPDYLIWFKDTGGSFYIKTSMDSTYVQCGHQFSLSAQAKVQDLTGSTAGSVHSDVLRMGLDYDTNGDDTWTTTFSSGAYKLFGDADDTTVQVHAFTDTSGSTEVLERSKSLASDVTLNVGRLTGDTHGDLETGGNDVVEVHDASTCASAVSSATVNPSDAANPDYTIFFEDAGGTLYIKTSVDSTYVQCGHAFTTTSRAKVQPLTTRIDGTVHTDVLRMGLDYAADGDDSWTTTFSSGAYKLFGDAADTSVQVHAFTDTSGSTEVLERSKSLASDVTLNVGRLTGDTHGDLETGGNDVVEVHDASTCASAVSSATVNPSDAANPDYTIFFEDAGGTLYIKTSVDSTYVQCGHAFTTTSRAKVQPLTAKVSGTVHTDVLRMGLDYATDGDDTWTTTFSSSAYRLFGDATDTTVQVHAYTDTSGSTEVLERGKSLASDVTFNVGRLTGDAHSDLETGGNDIVEVHDASNCASAVSSTTVNPSDAANPDYTIFFEDAGGTLYIKTSVDSTYVQCGHAFTTSSRAKVQPLTALIAGTVPSDIKRIGLDYATDGDDAWTTSFSSSAYKLFGDAADTSVLTHAFEDTGGATEVLERSKSLAGVNVPFDIVSVRALEDAIHVDLDDTAHHIVACSAPGGTALVSEDITGQAFEGVTIGDRLYIDMSGLSQLYLGVSTTALDCTATKLNTTTLLTGLQAGSSYQYTPIHKVSGDIPAGVSYVKLFTLTSQACTAAGTSLRGYDGLPDASPSANDYDLYVNRTEAQSVYIVFCDGSNARLFETTAKSGITGDLAVHLGKASGEAHSDLENAGTADNVEVFSDNTCTTEVSRHDVQPAVSAGVDYTVWFESTGTTAFYLEVTKDAAATQCGHGFTLSSQEATVELDGKASGTVHSDITKVGLDYGKDGTDNVWTTSTLSGTYAVYGDADYSSLHVHAYITGNVEVLEREKSITSDAVMNIARIASGGSGSVHDDLDTAKVIVCTAPDGSVLSTRDVAGSQYDAGTAHQYFEVTQATAYALVSSSTTSCTSADLRAGIKLTGLAGGQALVFSPAVKGSGDLPDDEPTVRLFLDDPGTGACGTGQVYVSSDTDTNSSKSDADYDVYGQNGITYYLVFCNGTNRILERSTSALGSADIDVGRLQGEVHVDLRNGGNDVIEVHSANTCASAVSTETVNPAAGTPDYIIWFEDSGSTLYIKTSVDADTYVQCGHAFTTTSQAKVQDLETRLAGTVHADVKRMGLDYDSNGDDTWTTTIPSSQYRLYGDKTDASILAHAYENTGGTTELLERTKALNAGDIVLDISRITGAVHTDLGGAQDKVRVYSDGDCTQELSSGTSSYHYSSGTYRTFFEHTTTSGYYSLDAQDADTGNVTRGLRVAASSVPASNVDLNIKLSGVVPDAVRTVAVDLAGDGVTASGGDPWAVLVKGAYRLYGPADATTQVRMWAESSPQSTAPLLQRARKLSSDAVLNVTTITGNVHSELKNNTDVVKVHASSAYDSELTNGTGSYHVSGSTYTVYLEDVHASGYYYLDVLDANSNNRTRGIRVAVDGTTDGAEATGIDLDVRLAGVVPAAFPSVALDLAKDGFTQTSGDPWTPDAKSSYMIFFGGDTDAYVQLYTTATPPGGTPPRLTRSIAKDTIFNVTAVTGTLHADLVSSASDETLAVYGGSDYEHRLSAGKDTVQMTGSNYKVYFDDVHASGQYYLQVNDSKGNVTRGSRFVPDGALDGLEKTGLDITAKLFGVVPPDVKTVSVDMAGDGTGPGDAYVNISDTTAPMTYAVYLPGTAWSVVHAHTGSHTSAPVLNRTRALPANSNAELNVTRITGKMHADLIHDNDTITAWGDANYTVEYTNGTTSYVPVNGTAPTYTTYIEDVLASGYYYLQVYEGATKDATKGLRVVPDGVVDGIEKENFDITVRIKGTVPDDVTLIETNTSSSSGDPYVANVSRSYHAYIPASQDNSTIFFINSSKLKEGKALAIIHNTTKVLDRDQSVSLALIHGEAHPLLETGNTKAFLSLKSDCSERLSTSKETTISDRSTRSDVELFYEFEATPVYVCINAPVTGGSLSIIRRANITEGEIMWQNFDVFVNGTVLDETVNGTVLAGLDLAASWDKDTADALSWETKVNLIGTTFRTFLDGNDTEHRVKVLRADGRPRILLRSGAAQSIEVVENTTSFTSTRLATDEPSLNWTKRFHMSNHGSAGVSMNLTYAPDQTSKDTAAVSLGARTMSTLQYNYTTPTPRIDSTALKITRKADGSGEHWEQTHDLVFLNSQEFTTKHLTGIIMQVWNDHRTSYIDDAWERNTTATSGETSIKDNTLYALRMVPHEYKDEYAYVEWNVPVIREYPSMRYRVKGYAPYPGSVGVGSGGSSSSTGGATSSGGTTTSSGGGATGGYVMDATFDITCNGGSVLSATSGSSAKLTCNFTELEGSVEALDVSVSVSGTSIRPDPQTFLLPALAHWIYKDEAQTLKDHVEYSRLKDIIMTTDIVCATTDVNIQVRGVFEREDEKSFVNETTVTIRLLRDDEACPICGDKLCEGGETSATCPGDCPLDLSGCGDNNCAGDEDADNCPGDCTKCGDGKCTGNETSATCCTDCACAAGTSCDPAQLLCLPDTVCGDNKCEEGEDLAGCPEDCSVCGDKQCTGDETTATCCADCGCPDGFACDLICLPVSICGDGTCDIDETTATCEKDCAVCGDGECSGDENQTSCCADCGCPDDGVCNRVLSICQISTCGDNKCEGGEVLTCPSDCATCGDGTCAPDETCCSDCGCFGEEECDTITQQCVVVGKEVSRSFDYQDEKEEEVGTGTGTGDVSGSGTGTATGTGDVSGTGSGTGAEPSAATKRKEERKRTVSSIAALVTKSRMATSGTSGGTSSSSVVAAKQVQAMVKRSLEEGREVNVKRDLNVKKTNEGFRSTVGIKLRNDGTDTKKGVRIVETIDKSIAGDVSQLVFDPPPDFILKDDPIVGWYIDLPPDEEVVIEYKVAKDLSEANASQFSQPVILVEDTACGDGVCASDEDLTTCPADCTCGNDKCDDGEDSSTCCSDCPCGDDFLCTAGGCITKGECGDGICGEGEDQSSCCTDCGCPADTLCSDGACRTVETAAGIGSPLLVGALMVLMVLTAGLSAISLRSHRAVIEEGVTARIAKPELVTKPVAPVEERPPTFDELADKTAASALTLRKEIEELGHLKEEEAALIAEVVGAEPTPVPVPRTSLPILERLEEEKLAAILEVLDRLEEIEGKDKKGKTEVEKGNGEA